MVDHIERGLISYRTVRWRLGGSFRSGGQSVFGESQTRRTDAGGRWFAEINEIRLYTDSARRVHEAMLLDWNNGNEKLVLHRFAGPLMLVPGRAPLVPFSDGTTFSDGTQFESGSGVTAELTEAAGLRSTTIKVKVWGARAFQGGEPFTITGPKYGDRLYGAARILSAEVVGNATVYALRISPPLREAFAAGTLVDLAKPRCTMRPDMTAEEMWPTYEAPDFLGQAALRFSETFKP